MGIIEKWIDRLEGRTINLSEDKQWGLIAARLLSIQEKKQMKNDVRYTLITSTVLKESALKKLANQLSMALLKLGQKSKCYSTEEFQAKSGGVGDQKLIIIYGGSITEDARTMLIAGRNEMEVILCEVHNTSNYTTISRIAYELTELGCDMLGTIYGKV